MHQRFRERSPVPLITEESLVLAGLLAEVLEKGTKTAAVAADRGQRFDVFLSHSYLDRRLVRGLRERLLNQGHSSYVDWIDDTDLVRDDVSRFTAARVRRRMENCRALLYATSPSAETSRWMKWELGLADGMGKPVAIIPVVPGAGAVRWFDGEEFLGLYPQIHRGQGNDRDSYHVQRALDRVPLDTWIAGNATPEPRLGLRMRRGLPGVAR